MKPLRIERTWLWAASAAVVVVLAAWLAPLPGLVTGEEQLVAPQMPQTRQVVDTARSRFDAARTAYLAYVGSHDLTALLAGMEGALSAARTGATAGASTSAVAAYGRSIIDYAAVLQEYAGAGESYLEALRNYDNDLMAWTRALGPDSEQLRNDTWPVVEYLKLYPAPTGLKTDPPQVTASQVASQTAALSAHLAALAPAAAPGPNEQALDAIATDVKAIWASGRSVEYVESLHQGYFQRLQSYDGEVQTVATGGAPQSQPAGRRWLATGLDLATALVLLVGLAALFAGRRGEPT